ncbi:MAG: hypothetical protein R3C49_02235 [Planctomycetaceae bacterium]
MSRSHGFGKTTSVEVVRSGSCWYPTIEGLFPAHSAIPDPEVFYRAVNCVQKTFIRVNADEVSYHLHILLRYELELAMIGGSLSVSDLQAAWDDGCRSLFGSSPSSDREGVLQDSHWAVGMFGYFPSYTIGSLYAAQLAEAYQQQHGLTGELVGDEFDHLLAWLRMNVHYAGHRMDAEDIIRKVTGSGIQVDAFFRHIERKHRER